MATTLQCTLLHSSAVDMHDVLLESSPVRGLSQLPHTLWLSVCLFYCVLVYGIIMCRERESPRRKLVAQISELEQARRDGKLTQKEFESRRARILLNERHAAAAEEEAARRGASGEEGLRRAVPIGAACCDRLLFGAGAGGRGLGSGQGEGLLHDPLLEGRGSDVHDL